VRIKGYGIAVDVPPGWDAKIYRRDDPAAQPNLHAANFPLPPEDGDFGSGALSTMGPGGIFMALGEYIHDVAGQGMFAPQGLPLPIHGSDLSPGTLQRRLPGQAGMQRFFTVGARPFGLYLVVGLQPDPAHLMALANQVLASLSVEA
jgi:hypothetical protein